ncbi:hypothetical protein C8A05DRAFT_18187 [Staphylotrichum tortipilum]|uniref:Zn(2)-C6 fungal-type domain-containing protein n=1 Tax=Staphylotrichum tortipilum TaxID=2831512 RepID=A0AAN6MFW6_9PEZI|nr:hypothetical protein C8A05DRAFT_18187 [Staphylotrichum longicolle]
MQNPRESQQQQSKGAGSRRSRAKTGCRSCKLRRVKCDEARPACRRCVSTGRVCDGYGIWGGGGNTYGSADREAAKLQQASDRVRQSLTVRTACPSFIPGIGPQELRALDYFWRRTAIKLPGVFGSAFWESIVFQATSSEPAVLHAVVALGAIHRSESAVDAGDQDDEPIEPDERLALQQYNKAISHLRARSESRDKRSLRVVLIACLVFICIELMRRKFRTAQAHLRSGVRLINEIQAASAQQSGVAPAGPSPQPASVDDELIEALTRLNIQSALFGQGAGHLQDIFPGCVAATLYEVPPSFPTSAVARHHLDRLIDGVTLLSVQAKSSSSPYPPSLHHRQHHLQSALSNWLQTYTTSLPTLLSPPSVSNLLAALGPHLLLLHHTMTTIIAATALPDPVTDEMVYDVYTPAFTAILAQAATLLRATAEYTGEGGGTRTRTKNLGFTIDMGFVPPLYFTALKCRVPRLRRAAVGMLASAPHREGVWDGDVAGWVAGFVVGVEEGSASMGGGIGGEGVGVDGGGGAVPGVDGDGDGAGLHWVGRHGEADEDVAPAVAVPAEMRINEVTVELPNEEGEMAAVVCKRWREDEGRWETWRREFDLTLCRVGMGI